MKINTSELIGQALDWAVAKCEGYAANIKLTDVVYVHPNGEWHHNGNWIPSTNWAQGGPIIEEEAISLTQFSDYPKWTAKHPESLCIDGITPLIAAMRCYVASKLGDVVDVPEGVTK